MAKKKFNLKIWIPVAVVLMILIGGVTMVLGSSTTVALLNVEEGNVQVDTGDGWEKATDGMELGISDKVKTTTGRAVLILYESVIVQLDENTEVTIEELSKKNTKLKQTSGTTWNKFAAISGLQSFEVETPTTVATVRGTDFWVDMESVGVSEGNVDVKMNGKLLKVASGRKAVLRQNIPKIETIDTEEVIEVLEKKEQVVNELKNLRQRELEKHKGTVDFVKKLRGWTDADIQRYMDKLDRGEYNEEELRKKIILPSDAVDKFAAITREIRKQREAIETIKGGNIERLAKAPAEDRPSEPEPQVIKPAKDTVLRTATIRNTQVREAEVGEAAIQEAEPAESNEGSTQNDSVVLVAKLPPENQVTGQVQMVDTSRLAAIQR